MNTPIKIAIAEDHTVFRQVFIESLNKSEDIEVVFGVGNGLELVTRLKKEPADVVLLDLDMPIMDGSAALEFISAQFPKIKVLILSLHYNDLHVRKYMRLGARGYLCKDFDYRTVVHAIREVHQVGYYFFDKVSPNLLAELVQNHTIEPEPRKVSENLTTRELEIIQLLYEQKTNQEIAEFLNISVRTVHNHRISITRKTDSRNVVGVLLYALKQGLITLQ